MKEEIMAKSNKLFIVLCSSVLFGSIFSGCSTYRGQDAYKDQPWTAHLTRAKGQIISKNYIETYEVQLEWFASDKNIIDANNITGSCENFLKREGLWEEPKWVPVVADTRYSWGIPRLPNHSIATELDASGKIVSTKEIIDNRDRGAGYEKVKTIVCLNPIVVVSVRGYIAHYDSLEIVSRGLFAVPENVQGVYVVLNHGFAYGTRMPYDPNPEWFSPDMNVTPQPVEMLSKDKGRIRVPWGWLILTREKDEWVVTTESK